MLRKLDRFKCWGQHGHQGPSTLELTLAYDAPGASSQDALRAVLTKFPSLKEIEGMSHLTGCAHTCQFGAWQH